MPGHKRTEILVTGGSGFLGREIVQRLAEKHPEWHISVLDLHPPPPHLRKCISQFIPADISSAESVNNAFVEYSPDLVVHTAGIVPARRDRYSTCPKQWEKVKGINYDGTKNVLDAAMASGCRRLVYTSSCTVLIDDLDHDYFNMDESFPLGKAFLHYGRSKGMAEAYVLSPKHAENGLIACALRPATIIGPEDTAVMSLIHDLIGKGETNFVVGDGDNFYDWMYIDNAVQAHVLAVENLLTTKTAAGHAMFISNQEPVYFWDAFLYIWAQFGHVPRYRIHIPTSIAWFVALIMEILTWFTGGAPTIDRGSVKDGMRTHYSNNDKAIRILGYIPEVDLAEGMRRSCDGYKKHLAGKAASMQNGDAAHLQNGISKKSR